MSKEIDAIYKKLQEINQRNTEEDPQCEEVERLVFAINKRLNKACEALGKIKALRQHKKVYDKIKDYTGVDADIVELIYDRLIDEVQQVRKHLKDEKVYKFLRDDWKDL